MGLCCCGRRREKKYLVWVFSAHAYYAQARNSPTRRPDSDPRRLGFKVTSVRPDGASRNASATRREVGRPPRVAVRSKLSCKRRSRRRSDAVDG